MISVLCFTTVGSYVASIVPKTTMGNFSVFMTLLLGIKFIIKPVVKPKKRFESATVKQKAIRSVICGSLVGFICGFVGAGGGMMMLLVLTSVLGYELKTAVGTSVFIMSATALTRSGKSFCHRRHAGYRSSGDMRYKHPCVCADSSGFRQQSKPKNAQPNYRRNTCYPRCRHTRRKLFRQIIKYTASAARMRS